MGVLDFKRSLTTPSTLAKGTLQFVSIGGKFKMLVGDNSNVPIEANYLSLQGGIIDGTITINSTVASPLILTRSGNVGIRLNGGYLGENSGVLKWGSNSNHANNNTVWHSGTIKVTNQVIEATKAFIIPTGSPTENGITVETGKNYLYISID